MKPRCKYLQKEIMAQQIIENRTRTGLIECRERAPAAMIEMASIGIEERIVCDLKREVAQQMAEWISDGREYIVCMESSHEAPSNEEFRAGISDFRTRGLVVLSHRRDTQIGEHCDIPNALSHDDLITYGDGSRFRRVGVNFAGQRRDYWERVA